jgi:hypothetical protein
MRDSYDYERRCIEIGSVRDKLFGLALLAFAVVALGAYSFAAGGDPPKPAPAATVSSGEVRTTPDNAKEMPPPVAPAQAR